MLLLILVDELPILFANGWDSSGVVRMIDMLSNRTCKSLEQYPLKLTATVGGLIHGKPIICGGRNRTVRKFFPSATCTIPLLTTGHTTPLLALVDGIARVLLLTKVCGSREDGDMDVI